MKNLLNNKNENQNLTIVIIISRMLEINEAKKLLNTNEEGVLSLAAKSEIQFFYNQGEIFFDEYDLWDWMFRQNQPMIKNYTNPSLNIFPN